MRLYDNSDLEEAMNAIKEQVLQDLSDAVLKDEVKRERSIEILDFN